MLIRCIFKKEYYSKILNICICRNIYFLNMAENLLKKIRSEFCRICNVILFQYLNTHTKDLELIFNKMQMYKLIAKKALKTM